MRVTWHDGTPVDVHFTAKSDQKSHVSIQHRNLASKAESNRIRSYWTERLAELSAVLHA